MTEGYLTDNHAMLIPCSMLCCCILKKMFVHMCFSNEVRIIYRDFKTTWENLEISFGRICVPVKRPGSHVLILAQYRTTTALTHVEFI